MSAPRISADTVKHVLTIESLYRDPAVFGVLQAEMAELRDAIVCDAPLEPLIARGTAANAARFVARALVYTYIAAISAEAAERDAALIARAAERVAMLRPGYSSLITALYRMLAKLDDGDVAVYRQLYHQSPEHRAAVTALADFRAENAVQADISFFADWQKFAGIVESFADAPGDICDIGRKEQTLVVISCLFILGMRFGEVFRAEVVQESGEWWYRGCMKGHIEGPVPFCTVISPEIAAVAVEKMRPLYAETDCARASANWSAKIKRYLTREAKKSGVTTRGRKWIKLPRVAAGIILGQVLLERRGLADTPLNRVRMTNLIIHHVQKPGYMANNAPYY